MWLRVLNLAIAVELLAKAGIALAVPQRFNGARRRQYPAESLPPKLLVAPAVITALTLLAWYATIFHYRPWCWVVTGSFTALSCMAVDHLFCCLWPPADLYKLSNLAPIFPQRKLYVEIR